MNKYFQINAEIEEKNCLEEIIQEIFLKKENKINEFWRNCYINIFDYKQKSLDNAKTVFIYLKGKKNS